MRPTSSVSLVCSLLLLLVASGSWGRCLDKTVEESFHESDYVFSGTVSQIDEQKEHEVLSEQSDSSDRKILQTVNFAVDKRWKGAYDDDDMIAISTRTGGIRSGEYYVIISPTMKFTVEDNYLIFAKRVQDDEENGDSGYLYTHVCYGNKKLDDLSESKALFAQLDKLSSTTQVDSDEAHDEESQIQEKQD